MKNLYITTMCSEQVFPRIMKHNRRVENTIAGRCLCNTILEDNLPTVNIEACGTPIVTFDTGDSPETIDVVTGIIVPRGDFAALPCYKQNPHNGEGSSYPSVYCPGSSKK